MPHPTRSNPLKSVERWLRHDVRHQLSRWFHTRSGRKFLARYLPDYVTQVCIDCGDHRLTVSPHEMVGRGVIRNGEFGRDQVDRVLAILTGRGLLEGRDVALDIGANIGTQTVYFGLSGRFSRILAVEPSPANLELLATNVRQNGFDDQVTIAACAVGETEATLDLHMDRLNHGGNSFVNITPGQVTIPVPVRRIDGLLAEHGIDPARVALVWMDIEGYEPAASRSMENLLARQVPVMTEFQSSFMGADGSAAFIAYLGRFYRDCIVFSLEAGEQPMPVSQIPIQDDILDVLLLPDAPRPGN